MEIHEHIIGSFEFRVGQHLVVIALLSDLVILGVAGVADGVLALNIFQLCALRIITEIHVSLFLFHKDVCNQVFDHGLKIGVFGVVLLCGPGFAQGQEGVFQTIHF